MTLEQHDQAVVALATMIGDWMRARPAAAAAENPKFPGRPSPQPAGEGDSSLREGD
jgi:hypothetical protein